MKRLYVLVAAGFVSACGAPADDPTNAPEPIVAPSKAEVASLAGKGDHIDWCARLGWYGDGICDTFCVDPDPDCAEPVEDPTPTDDVTEPDVDVDEEPTPSDSDVDPDPDPEPDPEPEPDEDVVVPTCDAFGSEPCDVSCRDASTWPQAWVDFEAEVLTLVNQRRSEGAECGAEGSFAPAEPLAAAPALAEAARCHGVDLASNGLFSHTGSDGSSFSERATQAGYGGFASNENIAAGYTTPAAVVAGWMASDGHCRNIMSASPDELGVGLVYDPQSAYSYYWTTVSGVAP